MVAVSTTSVPGATLIDRCLWVFWHEQFNVLSLDHPMRMAAVFALLADEVAPDEPDPVDADDYPYERGWWGCNALMRGQLMREVDAVVGVTRKPVDELPEMTNPCDPVVQQRRQDFLDWLYDCSQRKEQGDYTYTGLFQDYVKSEAARLNAEPAA
jgi:hypothetical protein